MNIFIPPLKVHLCWFDRPDFDSPCKEIATELFEFLHRPIADSIVTRPGLEIPVEFGRDLGHLLESLERGTEPEARIRVVVILVDAGTLKDETQRQLLQRACDRWGTARDGEVYIPIMLEPHWQEAPELKALASSQKEIEFVQNCAAGPDRKWKLGAALGIIAGQALQREVNNCTSSGPRPYFSHDDGGRALASKLSSHFETELHNESQHANTSDGDETALAAAITGGHRDTVLVVIRKDGSAEDLRGQLDLLLAKRARIPILTVMATSDGEARTSAIGGNHRTVNWRPGREWEVAARSVQAWLQVHYFDAFARAAAARAGLPAHSLVVTSRPELLDLFGVDASPARQLLIHPDPPLASAEAELMRRAQPAARFATPSTMLGRVLLANDPLPPLAGITIGLSLSVGTDLPIFGEGNLGTGLTDLHANEAIEMLVLATLHSGARIAYGGDFRRASGFAKLLSDLHSSRRKLGTGANSQLLCFVDQASQTRSGDAADELEFEREVVSVPKEFGRFVNLKSELWHLSMRDLMARRCDARVLLGGKLESSRVEGDEGYTGAWPGLLEEALRTISQGAALYLVGGFGGAAGAIARMLETGDVPLELTGAYLNGARARVSDLASARTDLSKQGVDKNLLLVDDTTPLDIESMAKRVLAHWQDFANVPEPNEQRLWKNGLTVAENRQLFRTTDPTEITHLVFEGVRRLAKPGKARIALYHGDIASVTDVGAYAVTITPGVPPVGASRAIDSKSGQAISNYSWPDNRSVAAIPLGADLVGRHAIVLRLPLAEPGSAVNDSTVGELANAAAVEADRLGITSIALVPFGTTLGIAAGESARAVAAGFHNSGGLEKTLVICESDEFRYQELRAALKDYTELRAGPAPAPSMTGTVLQVTVEAPTVEAPRGTLRSTLYSASNAGPVVPQHCAELTRPVWNRLRDPFSDFDDTTHLGKLLWNLSLSEQMQEQLADQQDSRLIFIGDSTASSLPWEILTNANEQSPARVAGLVRRVALSGRVAALAPDPGLGKRLRVLVVVNPDGLRSVEPERREIQAALAGYADVFVDVLKDASREQLRERLRLGRFDVLHYAGHASFEENSPSKTGLRLVDGHFGGNDMKELTSPRLVFLSACESGRIRAEQRKSPEPGAESSLAEAFLRQGVKAMLGTFFTVNDRAAREFSTSVYRSLASGSTLGTAVRKARCERFDAGDCDWANFLLYGNDNIVL